MESTKLHFQHSDIQNLPKLNQTLFKKVQLQKDVIESEKTKNEHENHEN